MGILHIEDLKPDDFISFVRHMNQCDITEKLDGTNLVVGMDKDGQMFTSREAKGSLERVYYPSQHLDSWPATHGNMLVAEALLNTFGEIQSYFKPGQSAVCELLYGRQPNAIVYGGNHLVFLHPHEALDNPWLASDWERLQNIDITIGPIVDFHVSFDDNHHTVIKETRSRLHFCGVPHINAKEFAFAPDVQVYFDLNKYVDWLDHGSVGSSLTNRELLQINLNQIPIADRSAVKTARESARSKSLVFKLEVKSYFLDKLADITPKLRDKKTQIKRSEDFGIEGVVITDPGGFRVKLVNKRLFTAINAFNHHVRNKIKRTSYGSVPDDMDWGVDFGRYESSHYDHMLEQLFLLHNIPGLKSYMGIKPGLRRHITNGEYRTTVENLAASWGMEKDVIVRTPIAVRGVIASIIFTNLQVLRGVRMQYLAKFPAFYLRIDRGIIVDGRTEHLIGYSKAVHNRTMLTFAQVEAEMEEMHRGICFAESLEEIIEVLFQKQLLSIH